MSTEIVGPLRRHRFGGYRNGVILAADLPSTTVDIRAQACAAHRFACDCREALLAEDRSELRGEIRAWERAAGEVLAGHRTWDWDSDSADWRGDGPLACQCHGCRLVRAAGASVRLVGGSYLTGRIAPRAES